MTRMPNSISRFGFVVLGAATLLSGGCGPSAERMKIDELTAENDVLKRDLSDRDRLLNDAAVRDNDARDTIDSLNKELAKSRTGKKGDEWVTMPSFDMISVPGSVLFESGKSELTTSGRSKLAQIASDIKAKYSDRDIFVFGHTDNEPIRKSKWKDNWELGANRGLTIVRTMTGLGLSPSQLVQASCGEFRPRDSNASSQGRTQNRRVEFYAVKSNRNALENVARSEDE